MLFGGILKAVDVEEDCKGNVDESDNYVECFEYVGDLRPLPFFLVL